MSPSIASLPSVSGVVRSDLELRRFEELVHMTERRAYSMSLQLTRNSSDAEDLVQETLIKAWRGFDSYVDGRPFLNWLLRIMQRAHLDNRRRDNPIRKAESLHSMISPSDGEIQELPIPSNDLGPDQTLIQSETRAQVYWALDQLPEVYRMAIVLCDLEDMSYSEIAELQHTTIGTVRSRIHRGRKLLREIIVATGLDL